MLDFLKNVGLVIFAIFAPAKAMILTSLALVMMDLVMGLLAARKQNIPITSSGLKRTVVKLAIYETAIILGFLTQQYLIGSDSVPVCNIIAGFIGLTELTSCLESLNIIGGNNILKVILDKLDMHEGPNKK